MYIGVCRYRSTRIAARSMAAHGWSRHQRLSALRRGCDARRARNCGPATSGESEHDKPNGVHCHRRHGRPHRVEAALAPAHSVGPKERLCHSRLSLDRDIAPWTGHAMCAFVSHYSASQTTSRYGSSSHCSNVHLVDQSGQSNGACPPCSRTADQTFVRFTSISAVFKGSQ